MSSGKFTTPLETALGGGRTLIEASAGSGKTRAITTIVARLVVERGLAIENILVVTFTKAATEELRKRIRRTFKAIQQAEGNAAAAEDGQARELLAKWEAFEELDQKRIMARVDLALLDIDRANILTIHGFCQRALIEFAFETGFTFDFEISGDGAGIVTGVVRDAWQNRFRDSSPMLADFLAKKRFMPDEIAGWYGSLRAKLFHDVRGVPDTVIGPAEAEDDCRTKLESVVSMWREHGVEFRRIVLENEALNRVKYRRNTIENHLARFERVAAATDLPTGIGGLAESARYFGAAKVSECCKPGRQVPENPLFAAFDELADACAGLLAQFENGLKQFRRQLIERGGVEIRRVIRKERRLGYDDLLIEMHDALERETTGQRLAGNICRRFPVALIDEFQDTDPIQERIFSNIYGSRRQSDAESGAESREGQCALFIVGDPKQSIYEFRGADIFAYLGAQQGSNTSLQLGSNWRSVPPLVEACNAIFDVPEAFTIPEIGFIPAQPGRDDARLEIGGRAPPPFTFWLPGDQGSVTDASEIVVNKTANDIVELLNRARSGQASLGNKPLQASDIAVLVARKADGRRIAMALRRRGGRCVEIDDSSVFETREAWQIYRLLLALAHPGRQDFRRGALAGDLFGLDSGQLLALSEDDSFWSDWSGRFDEWREHWQDSGVGAMLRKIIGAEGGAGNLLRYTDGPRRLTNVFHLAELLQEAETSNRFSPAGILAWLKRGLAGQAGAGNAEQDAFTLRLDSDEDLVKIMTIHKSKGLEFPIVYLPFAWFSREVRSSGDPVSYHIREDGGFPAILDLAPDDVGRSQRELEEFGESVRLLYVALTRARERCVVAWTRITNNRRKTLPPLAWLMHRRGRQAPRAEGEGEGMDDAVKFAAPVSVMEDHAATGEQFREMRREDFETDVAAVADKCPQGIETLAIAGDDLQRVDTIAEEAGAELESREFSRPLRRIRQLTSFSALAADHADLSPGRPSLETGAPDYDQSVGVISAEVGAGDTQPQPQVLDAFHFPRGVRVGTCLHGIFEILDEQPDGDLDQICREQLQRADIAPKWTPVARAMVENTLATELREPGHSGFRLADIDRRLVELEFCFPVQGLRRSGLAGTLADFGYPDLLHDGLDEQAIEGFMRGFIDLALEHDGRWYIVDYKSNWLGDDVDDYLPERIADTMRRHSYQLQYLIYLLALHRYLRSRLPDYDYDRYIGGAFYLFLRGMDPADDKARGICFDRPGKACIEALDDIMKSTES